MVAKKILGIAALALLLISCKKDKEETQEMPPVSNADFKHPGIMNTAPSFDLIKEKIAAKADPWYTTFVNFSKTPYASITYGMLGPTTFITRDDAISASAAINYKSIMESDFYAVYAQAIMWKLTGNNVYADNAIRIMNAWAKDLKAVRGGVDVNLTVSFNGFVLVSGAELLRDYPGWIEADKNTFKGMIRNVLYPVIKDIVILPNGANGTWDGANAKAIMAFGIFLDDQKMYDSAVDYFYNGSQFGTIKHYFLPTGQNQESGRNQGYAQLGLNNLMDICEMAYNQGNPNLWIANDTIMMKSFEYHAKYGLGNTVEYNASFPNVLPRTDLIFPAIAPQDRGVFRPIYYLAYNHFKNRLKREMPYTRQVIENNFIEQFNGTITDGIGWGSLLFTQESILGPQSLPPSYAGASGTINYEFATTEGWGGIGWAENSATSTFLGNLKISGNSGGNTYIRATKGGISLDPNTYPYLAIRVTNVPKPKVATDEWAIQIYLSVNGSNRDFVYKKSELTLVPGSNDVYYIKWAPKLNNNGTVQFPTTDGVYTGGMYLDFKNCMAGESAKVNWLRSYKTVTEIPTY